MTRSDWTWLTETLGIGCGPNGTPNRSCEWVVFDILRAGATITTLFTVPVATPLWITDRTDLCTQARTHLGADVCCGGERNAHRLPGFDFGNSPREVLALRERLRDRRVIFTTSHGTRLLTAGPRGHTWVGSLTNLSAVVQQIRTWLQRGTRCALIAAGGHLTDPPETNEDLYVIVYILWRIVPDLARQHWPDLCQRWDAHAGDPPWERVLRSTRHGRYLVSIGYGDDIQWIAAHRDTYAYIPHTVDDTAPLPELVPVVPR